MSHKSGFVNIIGLPNVGKSSLINFLIDEKLSIVNAKSQTTRQNIKGFINTDDAQIILVDTPGYIDEPSYQLQLNMNSYIELALEESDILLLVVDKFNLLQASHPLITQIQKSKTKTILLINKVDLCKPEELMSQLQYYDNLLELEEKICISIVENIGKEEIIKVLKNNIPEHPAYYDKEEWTDRNLRFICSETIREKILSNYQKEIPYSCEVVVEKFKETPQNTIIEAIIYVERLSQKKIIIGHEAQNLKKISIQAREEMESYLKTKVHLYIFVKVLDNWRNKENILNKFGYFSIGKKK